MADLPFLPLLQNAGLLLALAVIYDVVTGRWGGRIGLPGQVVAGLLIGVIGMVLMLTPWVLAPGVIFDARSVLLAVTGLVFGAVPTAIAVALTATLRLLQGGIAAWVGVSVILASGLIGLAWRHARRGRIDNLTLRELWLLGITVHVVMLLLMLPLPADTARRVLETISLPVLVIYPLATAALGALLLGRLRQVRAREDLRSSEERLRLATSAGQVGLWDLDVHAGLATVNGELERMLGHGPGKLSPELASWEERIHPDDRGPVRAALTDHLAGRTRAYRAEYRQQARDGSWRWILSVGEVVERDPAGAALRMLGTYVDVTARREAEDQARRHESELARLLDESAAARRALLSMNEDLRAAEHDLRELTLDLERRVQERTADLEEANRELEAFAYSVSHDLRAPLRAILGFSRILAGRHAATIDAEGRHFLDNIVAAGEQMGRLIEDLLAYSRVGRRAVRREPVPVEPIVARLARTYGSQLRDEGARLLVDEPLPAPLGDPTLVEQILANLVGNALTYHRADVVPEVRVTGHNGHGAVVIDVRDNGLGIAPEHHERIFDVFARLHSEEEFAGTGIGLAIARKAARAMGGDITVRSAPGEGSTFRVVLPAAGGAPG